MGSTIQTIIIKASVLCGRIRSRPEDVPAPFAGRWCITQRCVLESQASVTSCTGTLYGVLHVEYIQPMQWFSGSYIRETASEKHTMSWLRTYRYNNRIPKGGLHRHGYSSPGITPRMRSDSRPRAASNTVQLNILCCKSRTIGITTDDPLRSAVVVVLLAYGCRRVG